MSDQTADRQTGSLTGEGRKREVLIPLLLTLVIILADQAVKMLVVANIPLYTVAWSAADGLIRIVHARNPGIAFSMGRDLPGVVRGLLFTLIPVAVLLVLLVYYLRTSEFTRLQRWAVAAILGGGVGNIIDRIARPAGVVDFIDVRFFGIFGLERWPTFNIADSAVVIGGALLILSFLRHGKGESNDE